MFRPMASAFPPRLLSQKARLTITASRPPGASSSGRKCGPSGLDTKGGEKAGCDHRPNDLLRLLSTRIVVKVGAEGRGLIESAVRGLPIVEIRHTQRNAVLAPRGILPEHHGKPVGVSIWQRAK